MISKVKHVCRRLTVEKPEPRQRHFISGLSVLRGQRHKEYQSTRWVRVIARHNHDGACLG